jgi:spore maturation protein CgeB
MSTEDYYFQIRQPRILRGSELLPHEMKWKPYHYGDTKDVNFIGSRRHNNCMQLEQLRRHCFLNGLKYHHYGRHLVLRPPLVKKWYLSPEEMDKKTVEAYIAPAIQGVQIDDGYIPCRLFINMSLSVLAVSNNPYVYNLFDDDEVIVDRNIGKMIEKAEKIIKDHKVDEYTKKALEKVKEKHTYLNRIDELFSYL